MLLNCCLKIIILLILLANQKHQSLALRVKSKNIIKDSKSWPLEWYQKNKNKLISMTDQQIKFKLYQDLAKYSKIDQKFFNQILSKVLIKKKHEIQKERLFKYNLYSIRLGK
jgi:hypothetical protein